MNERYVHGYDPRETPGCRIRPDTLVDLLHSDTSYPAGSLVLEAGCGVGAQTVTWRAEAPAPIRLRRHLRGLDRGGQAGDRRGRPDERAVPARGHFAPALRAESFDHVFVCFLLEHLSRPVEALGDLKTLLKPGGTITVIEGDHGSAYFHPDSDGGPSGDRLPGRAAAGGRRQRADRPAALPAVGRGGSSTRFACPPHGVRRRAGPTSSTASPGRRSPRWSRASANPRSRRASRNRGLRCRNQGSLQDG